MPPRIDMSELGTTGLKRQGGIIYEEFLRELQGERGRRVFQEMADQDPVVGAFLFAVHMLMAQVERQVEPGRIPGADVDETDVEAARFVAECLDDMSLSWSDTLGDILSMLVYGWSYLEIVYKRRGGLDTDDPTRRSLYDDGKIGWRKWSIRAQTTLDRWEFDAYGGIQGMWQIAPPDYRPVFIPIDKALLFRTVASKGNPEGRSILRNAYRPWYFKKHIENIEGIGIERDLAGLPVAYGPPEMFQANASAEMKAVLDALKDIVVNIRRDEQEGVVFPLVYDENGNQLYRLELLSSGGTRQFDTDAIIARYDQRIAMSVMADFILLGHEGAGSYALSATKASLFKTALETWLDRIADVINTHAIPRLLRLNNMAGRCRLTFGKVGDVDLEVLGKFIAELSGAGMPLFPSVELENYLRGRANLPLLSEEEVQRRRESQAEPGRQDAMAADLDALRIALERIQRGW